MLGADGSECWLHNVFVKHVHDSVSLCHISLVNHILPARALSEHEAGVGQVLCVDDPPLQLIPTRSTLAFFVVLNAGSVTEAEETRLATSAPSPEALYTVCPPGASPMRAFFFPRIFCFSQ